MKFFNSQNCQRRKYNTVWLNVDNEDLASISFWTTHRGNDIEVTGKEFIQAKNRKVNYAYAGGIHEANYRCEITKDSVSYQFSFYLNTLSFSHPVFGDLTVYDYARGIFKGVPPINSLVMDFSVYINILTGEASLVNVHLINEEYSAVLQARSTGPSSAPDPSALTYLAPAIDPQTGSGIVEQLTPELAINMQTRAGHVDYIPGSVSRIHTDTETQSFQSFRIAAWFLEFKAQEVILYLVYADYQAYHPGEGGFQFWSSPSKSIGPVSAYKWHSSSGDIEVIELTRYPNTINFQ